tara:strand:- start:38 stop:400 length:363 start_codon:yes stop_codon:yes gene_type:complete
MSDIQETAKIKIDQKRYVYLNSPKYPDTTCIGINTGMYKGVVYKYGKVTLGEPDEKKDLPFRFEYDILDNNGLDKSQFDEVFFKQIGDILVEIIDEQAGNNNGTIDQHNRENDIIESNNE